MQIEFNLYGADLIRDLLDYRSYKKYCLERFTKLITKLLKHDFFIDGLNNQSTSKEIKEYTKIVFQGNYYSGYINTTEKCVSYYMDKNHMSYVNEYCKYMLLTPTVILEHFNELVLQSDETIYSQLSKLQDKRAGNQQVFDKHVNVLYVHGLGSSEESSLGQYLKSLSNDKYQVITKTFSVQPELAIKEVNQTIIDDDIDLVVGSSIGGFYSLNSICSYGVVVNPALLAHKDIENAIGLGEHEYTHPTNDKKTYTIDKKFIKQLKDIYGTEEYKEKTPHFIGIFGDHDELFSHYNEFISSQGKSQFAYTKMVNSGHHLDKECYPEVKKALEVMVNLILTLKTKRNY